MTARPLLPNQPVTANGLMPSRDLVEIIQRLVNVAGTGGGGGLTDGSYGDVTVSGGGTVITINSGAVSASEVAALSEAIDDRVAALLVAGTNITLTYDDVANTLTIAAAGGATNLSYTAATRIIASDTGTDATLPIVTSGDAGLAPASGGGTANFLRADGSWAAPPSGGGGASPATAWVI